MRAIRLSKRPVLECVTASWMLENPLICTTDKNRCEIHNMSRYEVPNHQSVTYFHDLSCFNELQLASTLAFPHLSHLLILDSNVFRNME